MCARVRACVCVGGNVCMCECVYIFCNIDYVYNVSSQMWIGVVQDTIQDNLLHFAKEGTLSCGQRTLRKQ